MVLLTKYLSRQEFKYWANLKLVGDMEDHNK